MNYQKIIVVGTATDKPEWKKAGKATFASFKLELRDGNNKVSLFPISVFSEYGRTQAKAIKTGQTVLIEGRLWIGDTRFNIIANHVVLSIPPGYKKA